LTPDKIHDYCPNGLQVEGKKEIKRVVTGVTASQALINKAIALQADALLVHHGYFWKGESAPVVGMKRNRLKALLINDINLYAYHLPLDVHSTLGNNVQLANLLDITVGGELPAGKPPSVVLKGYFETPLTVLELTQRLTERLHKAPLVEADANQTIRTVAWCTGGGQSFIELAAEHDIDAFITGEVSEQTIHVAREMGIAFFAAGHHATERYGIKALGEHLAEQHDVDVFFIDVDNPA
jgi:dinuclear metal center YbgI/SA1388 family protein